MDHVHFCLVCASTFVCEPDFKSHFSSYCLLLCSYHFFLPLGTVGDNSCVGSLSCCKLIQLRYSDYKLQNPCIFSHLCHYFSLLVPGFQYGYYGQGGNHMYISNIGSDSCLGEYSCTYTGKSRNNDFVTQWLKKPSILFLIVIFH